MIFWVGLISVIILGEIYYLILSLIAFKKLKKKLRKVSSTRKTLTKEAYIQLLKTKGYDEKHISVAYDDIRSYLNLSDKKFSMYPEDD